MRRRLLARSRRTKGLTWVLPVDAEGLDQGLEALAGRTEHDARCGTGGRGQERDPHAVLGEAEAARLRGVVLALVVPGPAVAHHLVGLAVVVAEHVAAHATQAVVAHRGLDESREHRARVVALLTGAEARITAADEHEVAVEHAIAKRTRRHQCRAESEPGAESGERDRGAHELHVRGGHEAAIAVVLHDDPLVGEIADEHSDARAIESGIRTQGRERGDRVLRQARGEGDDESWYEHGAVPGLGRSDPTHVAAIRRGGVDVDGRAEGRRRFSRTGRKSDTVRCRKRRWQGCAAAVSRDGTRREGESP
jgi:hypothetical protein